MSHGAVCSRTDFGGIEIFFFFKSKTNKTVQCVTRSQNLFTFSFYFKTKYSSFKYIIFLNIHCISCFLFLLTSLLLISFLIILFFLALPTSTSRASRRYSHAKSHAGKQSYKNAFFYFIFLSPKREFFFFHIF